MLVFDLVVKQQPSTLRLADLGQDVTLELALHGLDNLSGNTGRLNIDERSALETEDVRASRDADDRFSVKRGIEWRQMSATSSNEKEKRTHSRKDVQKTFFLPSRPAPILMRAFRSPSVDGIPVP
jgi:hypothetical protein